MQLFASSVVNKVSSFGYLTYGSWGLKLANASTCILSAFEFPLANNTVSTQFECPKGRTGKEVGNGCRI
jgi:hypothetical protein